MINKSNIKRLEARIVEFEQIQIKLQRLIKRDKVLKAEIDKEKIKKEQIKARIKRDAKNNEFKSE